MRGTHSRGMRTRGRLLLRIRAAGAGSKRGPGCAAGAMTPLARMNAPMMR